jgi:oxygen-dependent protoporphyrinogen oxidase
MTGTQSKPKLAVIGGGISGLSAAFRLTQLGHRDVSVLESSSRLGGVLLTERVDSALVECSADMFTTKQPGATRLCHDLGFDRELIGTNDRFRRSFVVRKGKLITTPPGLILMQPTRLWPILTSRLLSMRGRLRMLGEFFVREKTATDTSLEEFAIRRFGREAYERLIQPMVGGIYTADPTKLSVQATMPQFLQMEREHGSLIRAAFKEAKKGDRAADEQASGARYSAFVAPQQGMSSLIDSLQQRLTQSGVQVQLNTPVDSLQPKEAGWNVASRGTATVYDGVVLALPANRATELCHEFDSDLSDLLDAIPYASAGVALFLLERSKIAHPLNGFGFVVPQTERRKILAGSFASIKFSGRTSDDQVLVRVFIGGAVQQELLEHDDDQILEFSYRDLAELLGIQGLPIWSRLQRWHCAMPQYHVGHVAKVAEIDQRIALLTGLELAGNAYHGVGIPFCVAGGYAAAERLDASLGQ